MFDSGREAEAVVDDPAAQVGVDAEIEDAFDWKSIERELRCGEEERTWGNTSPSGLFALEIDTDTRYETGLSDAGLIDAIVGFERLAAWAQARQARLLAEFARRRPGDDNTMVATDKPCTMSEYAPDEVGLALKLARMTAKARLGRARQLEQVLPETRALWQQGRLDERRVGAICDATHYLTTGKARAVQQRILERAPEQTLGQLKAALKRAVVYVDPEGAAERYKAARRDRRVSLGEEHDGMASLWMLLSAPDAQASFQWLTRLAHGCGKDDPRGMDARRADLAAALLSGRLTHAAPDTDTEAHTATDDGADSEARTATDDGAGDEDEAGSVVDTEPDSQTAGAADATDSPATNSPATNSPATNSPGTNSPGTGGSAADGNAADGAAGGAVRTNAAAIGARTHPPPGDRGDGSGSPPRPVNPGKPLVQVLTAPRGALSYLL